MGSRKTFVRRIPQTARKKCEVCPLGWILMEDWDTKNVTLLNPISMESIDLPPIPRLPPLYRSQEPFRSNWSFQMTAPPTNESSIIILSFYFIQYVIFCYPHEKKWFVRKCRVENKDDAFLSIAVVNGNIYGYTFSQKLVQLNFNHCNFTIKCPEQQILPDEINCGDAHYLVESSGNLYIVQINRLRRTCTANGFIVFKMNFIEMRWEEAQDIGQNRAVFVDLMSEGVSCCAEEAGLQGNCIYYVNDDNYLYQYNLEDNSITMLSYFPRHRLPDSISPCWVFPQSNNLTNMDECKEMPTNLEGCHIGPERNFGECYKICNIENDFSTSSKLPCQEISTVGTSFMPEKEEIWSNLLPELVLELMHHLSYLDSRCALLAVPQWMPAICTIAKPIGTWYMDSPCLLNFSNGNKTCTLMDPIRNVRHLIQSPDLPSTLRVVSSKHGWLLLRGPTKGIVFFYNPLSKVVIKLPQPPEIFPSCLRFSFSHPPTSPNCVVVAEYLYPNSKRVLICQRGEKVWTDLIWEYEQEDEMPLIGMTSAVFVREKFHWLSVNGVLGVADPATRSWEIYPTYKFEKLPKTYRYYLVESDDEIFRVWVGKRGDWVRVFKLDYDNFTWNEVKNLGGRCFFLLQEATISVSSGILGNKQDRIYFPMLQNDQMVYYSCQAQEMLPSNTFYGAKEFVLRSCWIQPSWERPTSEELQWFRD